MSASSLLDCAIPFEDAWAGRVVPGDGDDGALDAEGELRAEQHARGYLSAHYEGEPVTLYVYTGGSATIYATWTLDANQEWCATFVTDNGTTLYAYYQGETGLGDGLAYYSFYTEDGREVNRTSEPSVLSGQYGPAGLSSFWQDAEDWDVWY